MYKGTRAWFQVVYVWGIIVMMASTGMALETKFVSMIAKEADSVPTVYQTIIPAGLLFGNFTKENGPYLIEGSIIVPSGEKLIFGSGCRIFVGGKYSTITVFGQMLVNGTSTDPVVIRSAKKDPDPWDWDRIYCRSKARSVFEGCVIEHANYGVYVENGSASFDGCEFRANSLCGLVVRNAEVSIQRSSFYKGHVQALLLLAGAVVKAESLKIFDNTTALVCASQSDLTLMGGVIKGNGTGVVAAEQSRIAIIGADIIHNGKGVVTQRAWPKKLLEMVYDNLVDASVETPEKFEVLAKPPEPVHTLALPKSNGAISLADGFTPGFSALAAQREQTVSFMGNVTTGFRYYKATSSNPDGSLQTRYPEGPAAIDGFQPELQIFTSGRQQNADINLLVDLYGNQWVDLPLHVKKNMVNLSANYQAQHLVLGDFFENGSETSIAGRKITGLQYSGEFMPIGRGSNLLSFKLSGGETEVAKDTGDHDLSIYNNTVDSGMSLRQQITYVAGLAIKPNLFTTINVKGIISRDQTHNPIFRKVITDPLAPLPVRAQTGCIDATVNLLGGALALTGEIDMGNHDTLDTSSIDEANAIAWYNPQVNKAIPSVFGSIGTGKNYALSFNAVGTYKGHALSGSYTTIGPRYFSAGNPYLEPDRRVIALADDKQVTEDISATVNYSYERRSKSQVFDLEQGTGSPVDRNTLSASGELTQKGRVPALSLEYTGSFENSLTRENYIPQGDSVEAIQKLTTQQFDNQIGLEAKQKFENNSDYSIKYQVLFNNDLTAYADATQQNLGDGIQHQISARSSFRVKKIFKNRISGRIATKHQNRNSFSGLSYKIADYSTFYVIPRVLSLDVNGEYSHKADSEVSDSGTNATTVTRFYAVETEAKYNFNPKMSLGLLIRYEKSADQTTGSTDTYTAPMGGLHLTCLF